MRCRSRLAGSSVSKGESLVEYAEYAGRHAADAIVMRHAASGATALSGAPACRRRSSTPRRCTRASHPGAARRATISTARRRSKASKWPSSGDPSRTRAWRAQNVHLLASSGSESCSAARFPAAAELAQLAPGVTLTTDIREHSRCRRDHDAAQCKLERNTKRRSGQRVFPLLCLQLEHLDLARPDAMSCTPPRINRGASFPPRSPIFSARSSSTRWRRIACDAC